MQDLLSPTADTLAAPSAKEMGRRALVTVLGFALYGFTVGYWRSPVMGFFVAVKMPLLIAFTLGCNGLLNGLLGILLGSGLGFRQSLHALLSAFAISASHSRGGGSGDVFSGGERAFRRLAPGGLGALRLSPHPYFHDRDGGTDRCGASWQTCSSPTAVPRSSPARPSPRGSPGTRFSGCSFPGYSGRFSDRRDLEVAFLREKSDERQFYRSRLVHR